MEFEQRKRATLASMNSPEPDKSPKGNIDEPLIPILKTLNSHPSYFTTSSCSGRIAIFHHPTTTTTTKKKAKGGRWVFITHELADPNSVLEILFPAAESTQCHLAEPGSLVFRFEPLIIAVECKDVGSAQNLVGLAISCGFRESGITSVSKRVIVAIRCSIRLEVPLGDTQMMMVSKAYVEYLVGIANEKMEANRKRTDGFLDALLRNGFQVPEISGESGECVLLNQELENSGREDEVNGNGGTRYDATNCGSLEVPEFSLSISRIAIIGDSVERLYLWGHSACTSEIAKPKKIIIFGGFGGLGRHARRNDSFLLDPVSGELESIHAPSSPSPRLGHTASLVRDLMFVVGGRADPGNILSDVWVLNTVKNEWNLLKCTGIVFPASHRHAAAVVGSKLYIFGGIHNDIISSSLYVLDTQNLVWDEIHVQGEKPCPRHSHSLVSYSSTLFMFGGYDGERALGDLYSFDVQTCMWKKEKIAGKAPYARFSHSMFVYKNYIGIVGGCPIKQHSRELSLFNTLSKVWKHVKLDSITEDLFVRSTASVVGDDLVILGGGASCYAFGTKFSEPMKMNLLPLISLADNSVKTNMTEKHAGGLYEKALETKNTYLEFPIDKFDDSSNGLEVEGLGNNGRHQIVPLHWVLQLERKYAKTGKDILKKFGWLDFGRKVYSQETGVHICFPVTEKFLGLYQTTQRSPGDEVKGLDDLVSSEFSDQWLLLKDISSSTAMNLLLACGATIHADHVVKIRKPPRSPLKVMNEAVASLLSDHNLPPELIEQLPARWERLGDIVVLPVTSFKDPIWDTLGKQLWPIVAESLGASRVARQGRVSPTGTRDSTLEILVGDNGWVDHRENGILYSFDATKCMFSWGNLSEKLRMAHLDCTNEVIVDLFAGIGYFTLPFLVRANAKLVYACEWNPHAIEALQRNLQANGVADRCIVLEGDNRVIAPKGVADRVCLGLLPVSEGSWVTAVRALRSNGGILHVHGNVKDTEEDLWAKQVAKSINEIATCEDYEWEVSVEHVERVKWYAPHIRHLVADIRCKQIER